MVGAEKGCFLFEDKFFHVFIAERENVDAEDNVDEEQCEEGEEEACEGWQIIGNECYLVAEEGKACG